jgi:hypothetical protein
LNREDAFLSLTGPEEPRIFLNIEVGAMLGLSRSSNSPGAQRPMQSLALLEWGSGGRNLP